MNLSFYRTLPVLLLCICLATTSAYGQQQLLAKNAMVALPSNYSFFSAPNTQLTDVARAHNPGYEQHPEVGMLFASTPCNDCYELIGKRTETSKTYIKAGSDGRDVMVQTASAPLHYRNSNGQWLTIKSQLRPIDSLPKKYAATEQPVPVTIDATQGGVSLGGLGRHIQFCKELQLVYVQPNGQETVLGTADWKHHTAGDDGVYVTDAWPGIDIEVYLIQGAVKTNFWIKKPMPAYAGGKLVVRDHLQLGDGMRLLPSSKGALEAGKSLKENLRVLDSRGGKVFDISAATAYEKANQKGTMELLAYRIKGSQLDIELPGSFLNRPLSAYPVIIDPLVSGATVSGVTGTTYSPGWTVGCMYTNPATVPAKVTITDIQFSFQYVTSGGAVLNNGAFDFRLGTCRSPTPTTVFWNCNSTLTGTCTGSGASIWSSMSTCAPPPQCLPYNMNILMGFYQNYLSEAPCSSTYISAGSPLTITVFGRTVEASAITASATNVCQGQPVTMSCSSTYGVSPYTYTWNPGALATATVVVTPTVTTTYTVTATDACGERSSSTKTITVIPVSAIGGPAAICVGRSATMSNTVSGGTWSVVHTSIATIGSASGVLFGVTSGITTISYTTTTGCTVSRTVAVVDPPDVILGATEVCQGSTATATNTTTGGTWTSSNTARATIGSSSGIITGITPGTVTLTYMGIGGCFVTSIFTVHPISAIGGAMSLCLGGSGTLTNLATGGTWVSSQPSVASIHPTSGVVAALAVGTSAITYTTPAGCSATATVTVGLLSPVSGPISICRGSTALFSHSSPGGTWASMDPGVATINSASGAATGVSAGTATISYIAPGGCYTATTVAVLPQEPIAGTTALCVGITATLSNLVAGGSWSSSHPATATVGSGTGIITGVAAGTATISYINPSGCLATISVTVLPPPGVITGAATVCQGYTVTFGNSVLGGAWVSSQPSVASAGLTTGIITGEGPGTATITYTTGGGCSVTKSITVYPSTPILGTMALCVGSSSSLSSATPGGIWASGNVAIATISSAGVVFAVAPGTSLISYTTALGCRSTVVFSVNALLPISGAATVCQGYTTTFSNGVAGGTWASSLPTVASVDMAGVVSGLASGTATITYTTPGGCFATSTLMVHPLGAISGVFSLCASTSTTLSITTPGGNWSSSAPAIATIGLSSGVVRGLSAGTAAISYTTGMGCIASATITVYPQLPITGAAAVCQGSVAMLANAVAGGIWSSSAPGVATVDGASGVYRGIAPGTATISYTTATSCLSTFTVTVYPLAPITGATNVCAGFSISLSNATPGGVWTSSSSSVASIGAVTGVVLGVAPGVVVIAYTTPAGCIATTTVTVNAQMPITGPTSVCQGLTTTLLNPVTGGTWSSSNTAIASIDGTTGVVSGVGPGIVTISYVNPSGCTSTFSLTVLPMAAIAGGSSVCAGSSLSLSNAVAGGTWSSSATGIASVHAGSGVLSGIAGGSAVISYATSAGCVSTHSVIVHPRLPISGIVTICNTSTLSNAVTGGTWSSSDPSVASIGPSSGIIMAFSGGTATITYTTPAGCISTVLFTVNPTLPIAGPTALCQGDTATMTVAATGGTWSSLSPSVASINPVTGLVSALGAGTAIIQYTATTGCISSMVLTVYANTPILGPATVCQGLLVTLTNASPGGTWLSGATGVATIDAATGVAGGVSIGTTTITYTTPFGCISYYSLGVNGRLPISGPSDICQGDTAFFTNAIAGGSWASSAVSVATVHPATGMAVGVSAGTAFIGYTTAAGCLSTAPLTIHAALPITGGTSVCQGYAITLSNAVPGGVWESSDAAVVGIHPVTGIASGILPGTVVIKYTTTVGCATTASLVVHPLAPITGVTTVCQGDSSLFNNVVPSGTWSSSATGVATISGTTGMAIGISPGVATITYTTPDGCIATTVLTVYATPGPITGGSHLCAGSSITLSNSLSGGLWSSSAPGIATVRPGTGLLTGNSAGTSTITYSAVGGCFATQVVTVSPLPAPITGVASLCEFSSVTLSSATLGGTWSSSSSSAAVGVGSGIVTGTSAGSSTITYTTVNGCIATASVLVYPQPTDIGGVRVICEGASTFLFNSLVGGSWSSSDPTIATINSVSGIATGISAGTVTISYTTAGGCYTTAGLTVNPTPVITGYLATDPTLCTSTDGTITLTGLQPGAVYTLDFTFGGVPTTISVTANSSGQIVLTGLSIGSYGNFQVTNVFGCPSNVLVGPVVLSLPPTPATPVAGNNTPVCEGTTIFLTATSTTAGVTYQWTGPGGFVSTLQNPFITGAILLHSGTYTVTATKFNCVTAAAGTIVVVRPVPVISNYSFTNPTTCQGREGTITLLGLSPGAAYTILYRFNGTPVTYAVTADMSGKILLTGLAAGVYEQMHVGAFNCTSNIVGPIELLDPAKPRPPYITSNSPLCPGKTLVFETVHELAGGITYDWTGPNGFSSTLSNPEIVDVSAMNAGTYSLTVRFRNCPGSAAHEVIIYPELKLTNVTESQVMALGGSITLHAAGAANYQWAPNNGTLNNLFIDSPIATPEVTTSYTVTGMNEWGCRATAELTITVDETIDEFVPNAFSPNGDGLNDIFRIGNAKFDKLVEFSIANRWGQIVYHNPYDLKSGWDGSFNGEPQDMGVYSYYIILSRPGGKLIYLKGDVTLVR